MGKILNNYKVNNADEIGIVIRKSFEGIHIIFKVNTWKSILKLSC